MSDPNALADCDITRTLQRLRAVAGRYPLDSVTTDVLDHWVAAIEARAARRERERIVAAVMELHRPIRVYDECDHDDCQADPIEVYDYMACTDSAIGWACETCCYDDEMPLENCPHGGCHNGVEWADSCPTHKLMEATDDETR